MAIYFVKQLYDIFAGFNDVFQPNVISFLESRGKVYDTY